MVQVPAGEPGHLRRYLEARRRRLVLAGLVVAWTLAAGLLTVRLAGRGLDDFFITYRYAQNLAAGRGFVFNPGERVFGLTAPGHGLLLGAASAVTGIEPHRLGTASTGLALVATALLLLAEGRRRGRTAEAALGGTLLVGSTLIWDVHGAEGPVALALLLAAAWLAGRRPALAGAVAGFAAWVRPEAALGAGLLALLVGARSWRRRGGDPRGDVTPAAEAAMPGGGGGQPAARPAVGEGRGEPARSGPGASAGAERWWGPGLRVAATAGLVGAVGLAAAWWWFGEPLPLPLTAKRLHAVWGAGAAATAGTGYWPAAWPHLSRHLGAAAPLTLALAAAGLVPLYRHGGRGARLLVLWAAALAVVHPLLGVRFALWYAVPQAAALAYGLAAAAGWAARRAAVAARTPTRGRAAERPPVPTPDAPVRSGGPAGDTTPKKASAAPGAETGGSPSPSQRWWLGRAAATAAAVLVLSPLATAVPAGGRWLADQRLRPHFAGYRDAGLWARRHTPPGAAIACVEVGTLAYFSDRPVEDLLGLVTPRSLPYIAEGDLMGAFLARPTELVVWRPRIRGLMGEVTSRPWFPAAYREAVRFAAGTTDETIVYRRRPGAEPPPPRPPRLPRHLRPDAGAEEPRPPSAPLIGERLALPIVSDAG